MVKKDLIGQIFGRLTVLKEAGVYVGKDGKRNGLKWLCQCTCGNLTEVLGGQLRKGRTSSCGCLRTENLRKAKRKGYGESATRYVYNIYRRGATQRGYSFNLSLEIFKELTALPCSYCGALPATEMKTTPRGSTFYGSFIYNGLDRVDNSIGYEEANVVPCCYMCNRMKNAHSEQEFLSKIKQIYENRF